MFKMPDEKQVEIKIFCLYLFDDLYDIIQFDHKEGVSFRVPTNGCT